MPFLEVWITNNLLVEHQICTNKPGYFKMYISIFLLQKILLNVQSNFLLIPHLTKINVWMVNI